MRTDPGIVIDIRHLARRAQRWVDTSGGTDTVDAGFVSFPLLVLDAERDAAWPLVTRLKDKRVFSADDCCDNCVTSSVASLQEVRRALVDAQAGLSNQREGQLVWILDWMLVVIRAFLTWEERTRSTDDGVRELTDHYRSMERTRHTINQLDVVRAHLRVALTALANIANTDVPTVTTPRLPEPAKLVAETKYLLSKGVNE